MMKRVVNAACVLGTITMLQIPAHAADDKDVIEYRQHIMKSMGEQAAALGQILSTAVPADNAIAHVQTLALMSSTALKAFEPKVVGGESKPEIWNNWADFSKRMNELSQGLNQSVKTAKAQGSDAALANILDVLTCKSCHDTYRNEKKK